VVYFDIKKVARQLAGLAFFPAASGIAFSRFRHETEKAIDPINPVNPACPVAPVDGTGVQLPKFKFS